MSKIVNCKCKPKKLNIYLDLDETLLHSIPLEVFNNLDSKTKKGLKSKYSYEYMDNIFIVFLRPGLYEFLAFLKNNTDKFTINVWTAATKSYADYIIISIFQKHFPIPIQYRLHRDHVKWSHHNMSSPKDLNALHNKYNLKDHCSCNTIIIDDLDKVYNADQYHSIPIKQFLASPDKSDNELTRVKKILLKIYEKCFNSSTNSKSVSKCVNKNIS